LAARTAARAAKDFAQADALRKELDALGIEVLDAGTESSWRVRV
jgi:cysteinyl-tRNA synthetase